MVVQRIDRTLCSQTCYIDDFLKLILKSTTFPYEELRKRVFEIDLVVLEGPEKISTGR